MSKTTSRVSSGKYMDLNNLQVYEVNLDDINNSLNWQFRFNGHHKDREPLTVAQHLKLCTKLADMLYPGDMGIKLDALMHDFAEYIYGDIVSPVKVNDKVRPGLKAYCEEVDAVVYQALWPSDHIPYTSEIYDGRKVCDYASMDIERRSMWRDQTGKHQWPETNTGTLTVKQKQDMFDEIQSERFVDLPAMYDGLIKQITTRIVYFDVDKGERIELGGPSY